MSTVFKPRRSSKGRMDQTGTTGKYAHAVLGAGELFLERQQTGTSYTEGSGSAASPVQYRMKIGDGTTEYANLGYADQTPVSASGAAGDGNIVGNVAQDTSNGGITATFQSLADKKVNSVTSNSSTTVANALNSVSDNNTLKDILGALKQAVSLCNTAITSLNDELPEITFSNNNRLITFRNNILIQFNTERIWKYDDDMSDSGDIWFPTKFSNIIRPFLSISVTHNEYIMVKNNDIYADSSGNYSSFSVNALEIHFNTSVTILPDEIEIKETNGINFNWSILEKDIQINWLAIGAK